jgi:hypothetical protein
MWSEVEREVNKHPHNTLASLRSKISEVMADMDMEVIIPPYKKLWSRTEAVVDASGDFIKKIMYVICIYIFPEIFTLTIYFIALNVSVEFVLIYRPHPVSINVLEGFS